MILFLPNADSGSAFGLASLLIANGPPQVWPCGAPDKTRLEALVAQQLGHSGSQTGMNLRFRLRKLIKIDQFPPDLNAHDTAMKVTEKQVLAVRCPTCGAKPGEKCELGTGLPRTESHRERRLAASNQ